MMINASHAQAFWKSSKQLTTIPTNMEFNLLNRTMLNLPMKLEFSLSQLWYITKSAFQLCMMVIHLFCFIWIFKAPSKWSDLEKRYILGFNLKFSSYSKGYSKSLTAITTRTGIPSVFGVIDSKSGIQNYLRSQKKPNIGFSSLNPRKYLLINSCTWKEFKNVKKP